MRFLFGASCLAMVACTPSEPVAVAVAPSGCSYSTLVEVAAAPSQADGKKLCSELYSYSKHGYLAFYDHRVHDTAEALQTEALLIGEEDAATNFKGSYPVDGVRVKVRGVLKLQMSCFAGQKDSCVPIRKPIYLIAPKLSVISQ